MNISVWHQRISAQASATKLKAAVLALLLALCSADVLASKLLLNGLAPRYEFSEVVFYGALFTEQRHSDNKSLLLSNEDKAFEIRIAKDTYYPRRWQRHWMEAIAINAGDAEVQKHAQTLADFLSLIDFKLVRGDIFRMERAGAEVRVSLNGQPLAQYADAEFINLLLRVWVGPVPISSIYKESMLAAGDLNAEWLESFSALQPSASRGAEVDRLLANSKAAPPPPKTGRPAAVSTPAPGTSVTATVSRPTAVTTPKPEPEPERAPSIAARAPEREVAPKPSPNGSTRAPSANVAAGSTTLASVNRASAVPAPPKKSTPKARAADDELEGNDRTIAIDSTRLIAHKRYVSDLILWTARFAQYPRRALNRGREGTVRIAVTIDSRGAVRASEIVDQAEHDDLNEAALRAIEAASPFPAIPASISGETYTFTVPVVFKIGGR